MAGLCKKQKGAKGSSELVILLRAEGKETLEIPIRGYEFTGSVIGEMERGYAQSHGIEVEDVETMIGERDFVEKLASEQDDSGRRVEID
ncbi:MAG: hypothetical protein LVQ97_00405 [Candidatus Micrarchaeales archaeon]|nr:hypothetical protein [Candidatus Micrarchaeales archaeon]